MQSLGRKKDMPPWSSGLEKGGGSTTHRPQERQVSEKEKEEEQRLQSKDKVRREELVDREWICDKQ